MLKNAVSIILGSRVAIAIVVIALASTDAAHIEKETRILEATIINKTIGFITIAANQYPGQIFTLSTHPETERIALRPGDQIIVEYSAAYIIESISRLG